MSTVKRKFTKDDLATENCTLRAHVSQLETDLQIYKQKARGNISWQELKDILIEVDPDNWIVNEDATLDFEDECVELIDTGSVTLNVQGRKYVVSLHVEVMP